MCTAAYKTTDHMEIMHGTHANAIKITLIRPTVWRLDDFWVHVSFLVRARLS